MVANNARRRACRPAVKCDSIMTPKIRSSPAAICVAMSCATPILPIVILFAVGMTAIDHEPWVELRFFQGFSGIVDAFRIVIRNDGQAHFVNRNKRTITFLHRVSNGVIGHEIGHVLGFGDHYQLYWNQQNCAFQGRAFQRDLMSNVGFAHALPGHWNILNRAYPFTHGKQVRNPRPFAYPASDVFQDDQSVGHKKGT